MAGPSLVGIWNLALTHIGQKPVESDTETTVQRLAITRVWEMALRDTLRSFNWGFARVVAVLATVSNYTPLHFTYAYAYPSKALNIWKITYDGAGEDYAGADYKVIFDPTNNQKLLITDVEDAYCEYTYEASDTTLFDPLFVTAVSHRLAAELAVSLNGDKKMSEAEIVLFNGTISEAKRIAYGEKKEKHPNNEVSDYVNARE